MSEIELIISEDEAGEAKGPICESSILKENQMSQLSIRIDEEIAFSLHRVSVDPYIFRVDELLHKENKRAYEPEILAIGPYHRNKDHLKMMEGYKLRYIQEFLRREGESSVGRYVEAMEELEEKARSCYADPVELDRDQFVKMMLFDGIFIIELVGNFLFPRSGKTDILQSHRIQNILFRDILLFENQLPLFVLIRLWGTANGPHFLPVEAFWTYIWQQTGFCGSFIRPPPEVDLHHLLGVVRYAMRPSFLDDLGGDTTFKRTGYAMVLQAYGIKFEKGDNRRPLMDIKFNNGIIEIPPFCINDDTEQLFKNLIAYEQYNHENEWPYVTSYVKFMNCLIQSPHDATILRQSKIFEIGERMDDVSIFSLFNKLSGAVRLGNYRNCYSKICHEIMEHCQRPRSIRMVIWRFRWYVWMVNWRRRWGIWMAKLKQDYFNSPWSVISLIGAFALLVLTVIQTVCSILQV